MRYRTCLLVLALSSLPAAYAQNGEMPTRVSVLYAYQLHISLNYSNPLIWRRLVVPADIILDTLHQAMQIAMGWQLSPEDKEIVELMREHSNRIARVEYRLSKDVSEKQIFDAMQAKDPPPPSIPPSIPSGFR